MKSSDNTLYFCVSYSSIQNVVGQAQLAHCVTWLDPIDGREMVQQSVANLTAARARTNMRDQYHRNGSFHGQGTNHGQDWDHNHDCEHGQTMGADTIALA